MLSPASFAKSRQDQFKACQHTLIKASKLGLMRGIELGPVVNVGRRRYVGPASECRKDTLRPHRKLLGTEGDDYRTHPMPDSSAWAALQ